MVGIIDRIWSSLNYLVRNMKFEVCEFISNIAIQPLDLDSFEDRFFLS